MAKVLLVVLAYLVRVSLALAAGWSYDISGADGPNSWGGVCSTGRKQSPIDIKTNTAQYDSSLGTFNLVDYDSKPSVTFLASNNGHTLKVSFPSYLYNVSGGGLPGTYTTVQFHLHWGSTNSQGSEHAVDGKFYPAENHFVSFNTKYPDIITALGHSDGLAVLGVFLQVGSYNAQYEKFLNYSSQLVNKSSEVSGIVAFEFDTLLPTDKSKFFRYNGSLTTPNCNEVVTWTVFKDSVEISQAQLDALRSLKMNNAMPLVDNFRPLQTLNGRTVKASFKEPTPPPTTPVSTTIPSGTVSTTIPSGTVSTTIPAVTVSTTLSAVTESGINALKISNAVLLSMLLGAFFFLQMF